MINIDSRTIDENNLSEATISTAKDIAKEQKKEIEQQRAELERLEKQKEIERQKTNKYYYDQEYYYELSEEDFILMCTVVSSETGYCEDKVQKAVAHTILNRLKSDKFPNTMYEVVTQRNQYTAIHSYFDGQYRPRLSPGSKLWNNTMRICKEVVNEKDFTYGAVAYYNPHMMGYNSWFESLEFTYEDQYGRFFRI